MAPIFKHSPIFNHEAVLRRATELRGPPCDWATTGPMNGSTNVAFVITFQDKVNWIFRYPRLGEPFMSVEDARELLASEIATMKYIRANSSVPVPEIFDFSCTADDPHKIGVPYILMSKAEGRQLKTYNWDSYRRESEKEDLSDDDKAKIMRQLGTISSQLFKLKFNQIGSIFEKKGGEYEVRKCLSPAFVFYGREHLEDIPRGPFDSPKDFYEAQCAAYFQHLCEIWLMHGNSFFVPAPQRKDFNNHELYRAENNKRNQWLQSKGNEPWSDQNLLDYFTAGIFMREMLSAIEPEPLLGFGLSHPDISSDNVFVGPSPDFEITAIIDWQYTSAVPASTALVPPGHPHSRDGTEPHLRQAFFDGIIADNITEDIPRLLLQQCTRKAWLLMRLIMLDSRIEVDHFRELYKLNEDTAPMSRSDVKTLFRKAQQQTPELIEIAKELAGREEEGEE